MFASATEELAKGVVARTYAMARARPALNSMLVKCRKNQRQDLIEFRRSIVFVAWARSAATLADKNIKYGHANEIPKWEHAKTSREAHPLKLFTDRFKDYWSSRKVLFEGTPTEFGTCPIEQKLLNGTNCRFNVPCPECKQYQPLVFGQIGDDDKAPGIKWSKPESGKSDAELARRTACYQCAYCDAKWLDHHRTWSIRRGVWIPAGCYVNDVAAMKAADSTAREWNGWKHCEWIIGTPLRDGDEASYQLSSLYALTLTWGDIAREFINSKDRPHLLRNFKNSWLGETWHVKKIRTTPELVAARLKGTTNRGTVPAEGLLLTVSIDRQGTDESLYVVYVVMAHGLNERSWIVDYGIANTPDEVWSSVIERHFPHADGGTLRPLMPVIDSGFKTHETYLFVNSHPGMLAVKGAGGDLGGAAYKVVTVGDDGRESKTGVTGQTLCHVNTDYWETELHARLTERSVDGAGALILCPEAARDADFMEQLLNGELADGFDKRGEQRKTWQKKDENFPNDIRDAVRYGLCARQAWLDTNGGAFTPRAKAGVAASNDNGIHYAGDMRPDGRGWHER